MSAIITGRVFWTDFKDLYYTNKQGKSVLVKETTAKIVMLAIADSADDYGENSWQSLDRIAQKASIDRRSVVRAIRVLVRDGYLISNGITNYGTNNFSINTAKLGNQPAKRAQVGRPKIGDTVAEISDTVSEIGDTVPSDPSYIPPVIPAQVFSLKREGKDLVDGWLDLLRSPGLKRTARLDAILSYIGGKLQINTETKRWKDFAKFVDDRQQTHGETIDRFIAWVMGQKNFSAQFWPPARMMELWPQAFISEMPVVTQSQQPSRSFNTLGERDL